MDFYLHICNDIVTVVSPCYLAHYTLDVGCNAQKCPYNMDLSWQCNICRPNSMGPESKGTSRQGKRTNVRQKKIKHIQQMSTGQQGQEVGSAKEESVAPLGYEACDAMAHAFWPRST